jgi:ABC-type multidrug transport system ATPase subunit
MKSAELITGIVIITLAIVSCSALSEISLAWNVTVSNNKLGKNVIEGVFGMARRGRLHAIVGPSGCGKTTLLNTLAGEWEGGQALKSQGLVRKLSPANPIYIQQADQLFAQLTARETLETTAALSGSENITTSLNALIRGLGLEKVQDTVVGDAKTRGLSGGERKRLSIGNEILLKQRSSSGEEGISLEDSYVFADEPTSGLDCFQAERVVALLRGLAERGSTVLVSIHQPRASIQRMFDDVTLLSEGGVVYSGSRCLLLRCSLIRE